MIRGWLAPSCGTGFPPIDVLRGTSNATHATHTRAAYPPRVRDRFT